jgi:hypothetical protein
MHVTKYFYDSSFSYKYFKCFKRINLPFFYNKNWSLYNHEIVSLIFQQKCYLKINYKPAKLTADVCLYI